MTTPALDAAPRDRRDVALDLLRKAVRDYLDGNYDGPHRYRMISASKSMCPHGIFYWEACENCIDEHFQLALSNAEELLR